MLLKVKDCRIKLKGLKRLLQIGLKTKCVSILDENSINNLELDLEILLIQRIESKIPLCKILQCFSNLPPCLKYIIISNSWNSHPFNPWCYERDSNDMINYPNEKYIKLPFGCKMMYHNSRIYGNDSHIKIFKQYR